MTRLARIIEAIAILCCLSLLVAVTPAHASGVPWKAGTEEFYAEFLWAHDATNQSVINVNTGWGHYVTDHVEVGADLAGLWAPTGSGALAGPSVVYNFMPFGCAKDGKCVGTLVFGGDASLTTGAVSDQAAGQMATWFGTKLWQGTTTSISLLGRYARAVGASGSDPSAPNGLDSRSIALRVSWGVPQAAPAP